MTRAAANKDPEADRVFFEKKLGDLETRLGHPFTRRELLRQALTHSSFASEEGKDSYERLEFLGDRVIELAASAWLFENRPWDEGRLSKIIAWLVDEDSLARAAEGLGLGEVLRLGRSHAGRRATTAVLADSFEALIGALFIDAGLDVASRVVVTSLLRDGEFGEPPVYYFSRSVLEERCRASGKALPSFSHVERGPQHEKEFECTVEIEGGLVGKGKGRTKKEAERRAAANLLEKMV